MPDATVRVLITGDPANLKAAIAAADSAVRGLGASVSSNMDQGAQGTDRATGAFDRIGRASQNLFFIKQAAEQVMGLGKAFIAGNAQFETFETQLGVMLKGTDSFAVGVERAKGRIAELSKFAETTPFELPEIVQAEKLLMTFGLTAEKAPEKVGMSLAKLRNVVGDAASMTQGTFNEVAMWVGRFATGSVGEAIMRLTELGITSRAELAEIGVGFTKSGELADRSAAGIDKATQALLGLMENKFSGGMIEQSKTFDGMMSTLKDTLAGLKRAVAEPFFDVFKESLAGLLGKLAELQPIATRIGEVLAGLPAPVLIAAPVVAALAAAFVGLGAIMGPLGATFGTLLSPLGILLPILLAVGAIALATRDHWSELGAAIMPLVEQLGGLVSAFASIAQAGLSEAAAAIQEFFAGLGEGLNVGGIAETLASVAEGVRGFVEGIREAAALDYSFADMLRAGFESAGLAAPELASAISAIETAVGIATGTIRVLGDVLKTTVGFLIEHKDMVITLLAVYAGYTVLSQATAAMTAWQTALKSSMLTTAAGAVKAFFAALLGGQGIIGGVTAAWKALDLAMTTNPIGLILKIITLAIVAFAAAWATNWGGIREKTASVIGFIKTHIDKILLLLGPIGIAILAVKKAWEGNWGGIRDAVMGAVDAISGKLGFLKPIVQKIIDLLNMIPGINIGSVGGEPTKEGMATANKAARQEEVGARQEAKAMREDKKSARDAAQAAKLAAKNAEAGAGEGAAGAAGAAGAGAADGAKAGAEAAKDPIQEAMSAISNVSSALSSFIDFVDKAFSFRGVPPPEILDEIFQAAAELIKRAGTLAAGISVEAAEATSQVFQMLQTVTGALMGVVDLAEKLSRFRIPTPDIVNELEKFAGIILEMAERLTTMFTGGAGLEKALAKAAVSQKVAESLKTWTEFLTQVAELTGKLARARFNVDMGPVEAFVIGLTAFVLRITDSLQKQLGPKLRIALLDAADIANTMKPWVELLKGIAEATVSLAKARWPSDLSRPLAFIEGLGEFVIKFLASMRARLGFQLPLALEDSNLIAGGLKEWTGVLKDVAEATQSLARFRPIKLDPLLDFLLDLANITGQIRSRALAALGPELLVALEDSREIAGTYKAWLEPIKMVGEALTGIDAVRAQAEQRADTTLDALLAFLIDLSGMTSRLVMGARQVLKGDLLVALEDSQAIAQTFKSWLEPLKELGAAVAGIDALRAQVQQRSDTTLTALLNFLIDLGGVTASLYSGAARALGSSLLVAMEDTRAIADSFKAWLEPLKLVGEAAKSVDQARAFTEQRADSSLAAAFDLMVAIAERTAEMVNAVAREAGAIDKQRLSVIIAQTFGAWMAPLKDIGTVIASLRRMEELDENDFQQAEDLLVAIASRTAAMVNAVAREAGALDRQALSVVLANTFGAWMTALSMFRQVTESLAEATFVPDRVLQNAIDLLVGIASRTAGMVDAIVRESDPEARQRLSAALAGSLGAWVDLLSKTSALTREMVATEPYDPSKLDTLQSLVTDLFDRLLLMSADFENMDIVARERLVPAVKAWLELTAATVGLFKSASELDFSKVTTVSHSLGMVEHNIRLIFETVRRMAEEFMPDTLSAMERLDRNMSKFTELAGKALSLMKDASSIGTEMDEATRLSGTRLALVRDAVFFVVSVVGTLARDWAAATENMTQATREMEMFSRTAGAALTAVKTTLDLLKGLEESEIGEVTTRIVGSVHAAIQGILSLLDTLKEDYLTAEGKLDEIRTDAIAGFSEAVGKAVSAIGGVLGLLKTLSDQQGQLGSFTVTARESVRQAVQDMVSLMDELAKGFDMGSVEGRRAMSQAEEFAGVVDKVAGAIGGVVDTMRSTGEFMLSDTYKKMSRLPNAAMRMQQALVQQITVMMASLSMVSDYLGMEVISQAATVAERLKPVADAIGSIFEPMQKLLDSKFVRGGPRTGERTAQLMIHGLKTLVAALIEGLQGITVPDGLDAGINRVVNLTQAIIDAVTRIQGLGEIDLEDFANRVGDLRRAAELLAQLGVPGMPGGDQGPGGEMGTPPYPGPTPPPPPPPPNPGKGEGQLPVLPPITITATIENVVDGKTITSAIKSFMGQASFDTSAAPTGS